MRLLFSIILVACSQLLWAEETPQADTLYIQLVRKASKKPLPEVIIKIQEEKIDAQVNEKGWLAIPNPGPGKHTISVEGKGIRKARKLIVLKPDAPTDTVTIDLYPYLTFHGKAGIAFSQQAYGTYWQGGGLNTVAMGSRVELGLRYKKNKASWDTDLLMVYGVIKQGENKFIKNEDRLELDSKYGYKLSPRFLATGLLNFRTHFHELYRIESDGSRGDLTGAFLSPGFLNLGTGLDYQLKKQGLSVYYSPINSKVTVVQDSQLAIIYLPPDYVERGVRYELGSYLKIIFQKEIMKNVVLATRADFFANHFSFGSIDVNWENNISLKVNKYLTANILTHLVYDEDIMFDILDSEGQATGQKGPRTQFRESLNIGVVTTF